MGKVWENVMSMVKVWMGVPEVRTIEDKLKIGCISMNACFEWYVGVEYNVRCYYKDIHVKLLLIHKLARIARDKGVRGIFVVTTVDHYGNTICEKITT